VGTYDGDTGGDDGEDNGDKEHESVDVVDLVGPKRGEDEVHLLNGNRSRYRVNSTGIIAVSGHVSTDNSAHQSQGENNEETDAGDGQLKNLYIIYVVDRP
jgi:hypothetical protein